ncbi:MAG: hypothetical protein IK127_03305 [Clostridia bacterium]|nr:hypothetical protein [Clostridia bacterium]
MKTPITLARLKTHLTYSWWKYVLAVVLCALGMNLFFTMTQAKAPEDQKIEWIIFGDLYGGSEFFNNWMENQRAEYFPDQADFSCSNITLEASSAGIQAWLARVGVGGDGDLLIMPRSTFEGYANGLFMDLDAMEGIQELLAEQGINAEAGRWKGPDGEQHTYGIPVSQMPTLCSWFIDPSQDYLLCVRANNGNEKVAEEMLKRVIENWTRGNDALSAAQVLGN